MDDFIDPNHASFCMDLLRQLSDEDRNLKCKCGRKIAYEAIANGLFYSTEPKAKLICGNSECRRKISFSFAPSGAKIPGDSYKAQSIEIKSGNGLYLLRSNE